MVPPDLHPPLHACSPPTELPPFPPSPPSPIPPLLQDLVLATAGLCLPLPATATACTTLQLSCPPFPPSPLQDLVLAILQNEQLIQLAPNSAQIVPLLAGTKQNVFSKQTNAEVVVAAQGSTPGEMERLGACMRTCDTAATVCTACTACTTYECFPA